MDSKILATLALYTNNRFAMTIYYIWVIANIPPPLGFVSRSDYVWRAPMAYAYSAPRAHAYSAPMHGIPLAQTGSLRTDLALAMTRRT